MTETEWGRKIKESMESIGVIIVPHQMGRNVSNVADKSWISRFGNWFVEYKGARTRITTGQKLWHQRINRRYKCAVVLRRLPSGGARLELADGSLLGFVPCPVDHSMSCLTEMSELIQEWRSEGH